MFSLLSPSNIFHLIEKLISFINSIFFILLLIALSFALIFSPPDYLQGDSVRINGKKRDELQEIIQVIKDQNYDIPLQFVNFRD